MAEAIPHTSDFPEQLGQMSAQARPKRRTGFARFMPWSQEDYESDLIRDVGVAEPLDPVQVALIAEISLLDNRSCFLLGPGAPERWEIKRLLINSLFSDVPVKERHFLRRAQQLFHDYQESRHRRLYLLGVILAISLPLVGSTVLHRWATYFHLSIEDASSGLGMEPAALITLLTFAGLGTFCSVAARLSTMDLAEQTDHRLLLLSGAFRPITAQIFALAIYKLVQLGLITVAVHDGKQGDLNAVIAFLSGFSERFAGELILRTAGAFGTSTDSARPPAAPSNPLPVNR